MIFKEELKKVLQTDFEEEEVKRCLEMPAQEATEMHILENHLSFSNGRAGKCKCNNCHRIPRLMVVRM